jgi:hypothetical protein
MVVKWVTDARSDSSGESWEFMLAILEVRDRDISPGFLINFVQGSEALFPVLVVGVGHWEGKGGGWVHTGKGLLVNGTMMISAKRGIQWDRFQIRVSGRGRVHWKKRLKNDRYHCDQGEERNPMG